MDQQLHSSRQSHKLPLDLSALNMAIVVTLSFVTHMKVILYVDCANQTEATITCYALSLHVFGVACSAAWAIFKLAIIITTVYVRAGEAFLQYTKNRKCVSTCTWTVLISLGVIVGVSIGIDAYIFFIAANRDLLAWFTKYAGYWYLPVWLCVGLIAIMWNLEAHCKQTQYNTLSPRQFPPNPLPQQGH